MSVSRTFNAVLFASTLAVAIPTAARAADEPAAVRPAPRGLTTAPVDPDLKLRQTSGAHGLPAAAGWTEKGTASQQAPAAAAATNNPPPNAPYNNAAPASPTYTTNPGYNNDGYRNYDSSAPYYGPYGGYGSYGGYGGYAPDYSVPSLPAPPPNTEPTRDPTKPYVNMPPSISDRPERGPLQRSQVKPPPGAIPGNENPIPDTGSSQPDDSARPAGNRSGAAPPSRPEPKSDVVQPQPTSPPRNPVSGSGGTAPPPKAPGNGPPRANSSGSSGGDGGTSGQRGR